MKLTKRDFLLGAGGALAALAATGCGPRERAIVRGAGPGRAPRLREAMQARVAAGELPGAVWLLSRGDDVTVEAVGVTAIDGTAPMRRDTIFRIASMTKPVTAAAVLMLVDEGKVRLDEPVHRWLPELANRRVLKRIDGPIDDTVPAEREITVRDVMAFTLGFGIQFDPTLPIQRAIDALQLVNGPPVPMTPHPPDEWMRRLGTLPLMHQPGAQWMYNTGSLLQGVLVARVSGQPFDRFVHERILEPLGMRDTGFFVPPEKLGRFAGCAVFTDPQSGTKLRMDRDGAESAYAAAPIFPSGAAGLVSTADDFLQFGRMLAKGGVHGRSRLLSEASVRTMTTNQLAPAQAAASASSFFPGFFDTNGWGYGMAVQTAPDAISANVGRYGWFGGFGTEWINDPGRDLIGIVLTQSSDFLFNGAREVFWKDVYAV